jgi:hypothetical protein|tara:strand:+ start:228 stop:872 length:645 start_codon:yes stop_codon:yes gene_type:complete
MAKVDVSTLVEYLRGFGVADALIPALIMTASFESGIQTGVEGTNPNQTKDFGVFQVNVEEFYDGDEPDKTITTFFDKKGKEYSKDELKKLLKDNEKFSAEFAAHYINRLENNPESFDTGGDPLVKWTEYRERVKPFLSGEKIEGRTAPDIQDAINSYFDAYLLVHNLQETENIKQNLENLNDPKTGENKVFHQYFIPNLKAGNIKELDPLAKDK